MKKQLLFFYILVASCLNAQPWTELGSGANSLSSNWTITSLVSDAQGNIYAAGGLGQVNGPTHVAKWNGTAWSKLGDDLDSSLVIVVYAMCIDPAGNIYVAGASNNLQTSHVMKWNGSVWADLGAIPNSSSPAYFIYALCSDPAGNIYAAGNFANASGQCFVAKWNGGSWSTLANGLPTNYQTIYALCSDPFGAIYAAGIIRKSAAPLPGYYYYVTRWNGTAWSEVGSGANMLNANARINALVSDAAGNVYAAGNFYNDSVSTYVAKWNGTTWSELGGLDGLKGKGYLYALAVDNSGSVYTAGGLTDSIVDYYYVSKWNGSSWSRIGNLDASGGVVEALCTDPAGNIYAAGGFKNASGQFYVAKFGSAVMSVSRLDDDETWMRVFPNPSPGGFTVEFDPTRPSADMIISNALGQVLLTKRVAPGEVIPLDQAPAGIYLVRLSAPNFQQAEKLIISR